jgi:hypothetical protein
MKTWKILNSENELLTFTEDDLIYTLFVTNENGENTTILKAVDDGNGFQFITKMYKNMDYIDMDYMRLFLNLIGKMDHSLYDSYIITEPIGQI